jgi:hypothetical protein
MTENDKSLISQAKSCREWQDAANIEDQADSKEAKRLIHNYTMRLYHAEEYAAGIL